MGKDPLVVESTMSVQGHFLALSFPAGLKWKSRPVLFGESTCVEKRTTNAWDKLKDDLSRRCSNGVLIRHRWWCCFHASHLIVYDLFVMNCVVWFQRIFKQDSPGADLIYVSGTRDNLIITTERNVSLYRLRLNQT
jgi:hypothetical protein